jgi:hypothetical protein
MVAIMPRKRATRQDYIVGHVTQNMTAYGLVLLNWNDFELLIEIAIRNLLGISSREAHAVLGGLMFKSKFSILKSLAAQKGLTDHPAMKVARALAKYAERNHLIHGYAWHSDDEIGFVKRNVDERLTVKEKVFSHSDLGKHCLWMTAAVSQFREDLGLRGQDVSGYRRTAENLIKRPSTSPKPPSSKMAS